MIGQRAEEILNQAVRYAFERQHEYFTLEHVLLSLIEEQSIIETIQACGASYTQMKAQLEDYLDREVPRVSSTRGESLGSEAEEENPMMDHPVATLSIQRLIQRALFHVQSAGKDEIQPEDLFVALFQAKDAFAIHLLNRQGVQRLDVLNYLSHGFRKDDDEFISRAEKGDPSLEGVRREVGAGGDALSSYAVNLNDLAKQGRIDPLIGRDDEIERMIQTLCRRRKNNPLLVGEAGVGKTALAEGLAIRVIQGNVPIPLEDAEIYSLDMGALLAGAKFRGDFEQRLKKVLTSIQQKKEKGVKPLLFIDEIHTIIGAGAVSGGVLDAANLLKPFLSRGELQCIGSTTYEEYRNVFEKDTALARRFQKIEVPEPSPDETVRILHGLKSRFEEHHGVRYADQAIQAAVDLSVRHLPDRFLPDKAIDVMDEVGARIRLKQAAQKESDVIANQRKERGKASYLRPAEVLEERVEITENDVEETIAQIARIPARSVSSSQKERLKNLERDLKLTIYGQDHAISSLVNAIRLARSGLRTPDKPVGNFLFCGPTGVGKTELSKQLARSLGVPFLRYDMSEYMEKHTVSRLIGAPPGYVGFEQAGLLTEEVRKHPYSVILLDEVEKGHPDVWNILLQVMDHGVLTDNNGRKSDFRNTILVMTSNVGSREHERNPLGMIKDHNIAKASEKEVERTFSPEFRNRLDAIVYFNPLGPVTIAEVVGKQLLELESQLLEKSVEIEFDSDVREWLARKGYDKRLGARPMTRLIQEEIKKPLAEEILFGRLEHGGRVRVLVKADKPDFEIESKPEGGSSSQTVGSGISRGGSR
jgi:ATP-dependent Clp protease ATP-binding subunit ClpA